MPTLISKTKKTANINPPAILPLPVGDTIFNQAMQYIFPNEGVFSNDPADPGGPTKYGISLRFLKATGLKYDFLGNGVIDIRTIQSITPYKAYLIYYNEFWHPQNFEYLENPRVAIKIFDAGINIGMYKSIKSAQDAYNKMKMIGYTHFERLQIDGKMGPISIRNFNSILPITDLPQFFASFCDNLVAYYQYLAKNNPIFQKQLKGWINRANKLP